MPAASNVVPLAEHADVRLVRELTSGATRAKEALVERVFPLIDALVWQTLGADDEHGDVVNEVVVSVLKHADKLRRADALEPWVRSIALNVMRSVLRKRHIRNLFRRQQPVSDERFSFVPDPAARLTLVRIFSVLERLPPDTRLAFSLRYFDGLTMPQVAESLDVSLATAKRRLEKASEAIAALEREPV